MRPPDQIPNLIVGDTYYIKRASVYHQCTLKSLDEVAPLGKVAKVDYYATGEPLICRQSELLSDGEYQEIIKQRRREAYQASEGKRREEASERYKDIIHHWSRGLRKSDEIGSLIGQSARATGQMIATAKRWQLITEDEPKP